MNSKLWNLVKIKKKNFRKLVRSNFIINHLNFRHALTVSTLYYYKLETYGKKCLIIIRYTTVVYVCIISTWLLLFVYIYIFNESV